MIEVDYKYFFFKPIPFEYVKWKLEDKLSIDLIQEGYAEWMKWFAHHARLFYHDQLFQHRRKVYEAFTREHHLPDDGGDTIGSTPELDSEFKEALSFNNFFEHKRLRKEFMDYVGSFFDDKDDEPILVSSSELLEEWLSTIPRGRSLNHDITRMWFNGLIDNSPKLVEHLRNMPYDEYLRTEHWYRVRALTIYTYRASCCSAECRGWGDQLWIEYAHRRQVHHISYKNRGNERFGDVCVLCKDCHRKIHSGKELLDDMSTYVYF